MYILIYNIAQFLFLIASFPNLAAVIKNRNILKGYSFYGAFLTCVGYIFIMSYGYLENGLWFICIPNLIFWVLSTFYSKKQLYNLNIWLKKHQR